MMFSYKILSQSDLDSTAGILNETSSWQFTEFLGAGSFGEVYRATCNGNSYAIKFLTVESELDSFKFEAWIGHQVYETVNAPNAFFGAFYVMPSYTLCVSEPSGAEDLPTHYYIMPLMDGHLRSLMTGNGLAVTDALDIVTQLLSGVSFLHYRLGVAHRDICPDNIFILQDLQRRSGVLCKIGDPGQAGRVDISVQYVLNADTHVGTPGYLAPEIEDGFYDSKVDVWSIGVILYELLAGDVLFTDQVLTSMRRDYFRKILLDNDDISRSIDRPITFLETVDSALLNYIQLLVKWEATQRLFSQDALSEAERLQGELSRDLVNNAVSNEAD